MSPKQTQLYWRLWGEACRAQGWRTVRGILTLGTPETEQISKIHTLAAGLAQSAHRAIIPDDLRHAIHTLAAGRNISSAALTNAQLDRVYSLLRLCIDPTNLDASIALEHPEQGERRRLVKHIQQYAPESYILAITARQFPSQYESPFWEDLPIKSLRALHLTISERTHRFTRRIPQTPNPRATIDVSRRDPSPVPAETPF